MVCVVDCIDYKSHMNIYFNIASYLLAAAFGFGGGLHWQEVTVSNLKLEHANERIAIQRVSRQTIERQEARVLAAQAKAQSRAVAAAADGDSNSTDLERLRIATETAVRAAASDLDACTAKVRAFSVVSTECSTQLKTLAGHADEWVNQALTLQEAWPKN